MLSCTHFLLSCLPPSSCIGFLRRLIASTGLNMQTASKGASSFSQLQSILVSLRTADSYVIVGCNFGKPWGSTMGKPFRTHVPCPLMLIFGILLSAKNPTYIGSAQKTKYRGISIECMNLLQPPED